MRETKMESHTQCPAPSISGEPPSGKDPPHPTSQSVQAYEQPGGEDFDRDGNTEDEEADVKEQDSKSLPPPLPTSPRRTSYRAAEGGGTIPQSPGIIVTQPISELSSLKSKPGAMRKMNGSGSASQSQRDREAHQGNTQHSLEFNKGLAGTAGTVRRIGGDHLDAGSAQIQRPDFVPFFTLVHNIGSTNTCESAEGGSASKTFHPSRVHYIFADDEENGVLTEALVRSLEASNRLLPISGSGTSDKGKGREGQREREERVVIVDMNEIGDGIKGAFSANPSWAVLSAVVGNAPTWDGSSGGDGLEERMGGLMLKIEGVGVDASSSNPGINTTSHPSTGGDGNQSATASGTSLGENEMQTLLEGFDRKMALLRRVVASGEEFRRGRNGENGEDRPVKA